VTEKLEKQKKDNIVVQLRHEMELNQGKILNWLLETI
jgi:hypothetical protein